MKPLTRHETYLELKNIQRNYDIVNNGAELLIITCADGDGQNPQMMYTYAHNNIASDTSYYQVLIYLEYMGYVKLHHRGGNPIKYINHVLLTPEGDKYIKFFDAEMESIKYEQDFVWRWLTKLLALYGLGTIAWKIVANITG